MISKTKKITFLDKRWKGKEAGYLAIHKWVRNRKTKPENCECCGKKKRLTLSSKTHEYTRNLDEYKWLCYSCHIKYDLDNGLRKAKPITKQKVICEYCEKEFLKHPSYIKKSNNHQG